MRMNTLLFTSQNGARAATLHRADGTVVRSLGTEPDIDEMIQNSDIFIEYLTKTNKQGENLYGKTQAISSLSIGSRTTRMDEIDDWFGTKPQGT